MNWPTSGPSANYSKLLVSDTTNVFDQNTCFLQDVLVSKQKISALLNFDQVVYIYHAGQVSFKNLKALEQRCCLNFSETGSQLIFSKSFTPMWLLLSSWRQYLIHLFWTVCNLLFNFLFRFGHGCVDTKLSRHNQNVVELKHYTRVVLDMVLNICFSCKGI